MSFSAFARRSAQAPAPTGRVAPLSLAPKPLSPPARVYAPAYVGAGVAHRSPAGYALGSGGLGSSPVLQRKAAGAFAPAVAPPIVHRVLSTPGRPLDQPTRSFFEQRLQYDFSRVRIHADDQASQSAAAVNARAYTVGSQIVFGQGSTDRRLLGHELTHVVQQGAFPRHSSRIPVHTDPAAEREADHAATRIDRGQEVGAVSNGAQSRAVIQRQEAPAPAASLGYTEQGAIEFAAAPAIPLGSTAHGMVKATLRGFYLEMKTNGPAHAQELWDHVKDAFYHPTEIKEFILHYWWGLVKGIFSPITGLFDLGKLVVKLGIISAKIQATAWRRRTELVSDLTTLGADMQALGSRAGDALNSFLNNKIETIRKIAPWFSSLEQKAVSAAEDGGHKAGQVLLAQTGKPLPELGETAGEIVGTVLINAVLIAFTDGIGNGISQIAAKLGELGEWLGKFGEAGAMIGKLVEGIGELLGTVGGWITKAETALAKMAEAVLKPLSPLLEQFGSVMKSLRAFLRDLLGASEEAATTAGGELAGGAAKAAEKPHIGAPAKAAPHAPPPKAAPLERPATVPKATTADPAAASPAKAAARKDADVIDLAAERERRALAEQARAKARKAVPEQKIAVGDDRTRAAYTDEEIAAEHEQATQYRGQGDQINKKDPVGIRDRRANAPTYEYDPWTGDSALLGKRLGPPPGPGYEAHHMVPAGEERAAALRDFMRKRGWKDINDADNGVWLPRGSQAQNLGGEFKHEFTFDQGHFDDEYFQRLEDILMRDPKISPSGLRLKLRGIRTYLMRGQLPPASL